MQLRCWNPPVSLVMHCILYYLVCSSVPAAICNTCVACGCFLFIFCHHSVGEIILFVTRHQLRNYNKYSKEKKLHGENVIVAIISTITVHQFQPFHCNSGKSLFMRHSFGILVEQYLTLDTTTILTLPILTVSKTV